MESLLRVYLNGIFIEDEPLNLPDLELSLVRDETLKGVFFSFSSEVIFRGDGYALLKAIRDSSMGCAQPTCNVEYKCAETNGWEVLYEGIIPLGSDEVEWDDYNCTVTTKIESADFSKFLEDYGDYVVQINAENGLDNATAITPITTNLTELFPAFNGTYSGNPIKTYLFTDVLSFVLRFLTNNEITLNADPRYLQLYNAQQITLNVAAIAPGDVMTLSFTNYYGQDYEVTHTSTTTSVLSEIEALLRASLHAVDATGVTTNRGDQMEKVSHHNGVTAINYLPWSVWEFAVNGNPESAIETTPFQYGLKNLAVTNSTLIQEQDGTLYITLNELMIHASEMHNMGFRLVKTGSGYSFTLRTIDSMLDPTDTTVNLPQVSAITSKSSGEFNAKTITSPKGIADSIFKPASWNTANCYGDSIKVEGDRFSSQEFFDIQNATQVQDDAIFWLFLKDGDYTLAEKFPVSRVNNLGASDTIYHYNAPYFGPLIAKQYEVNAANRNLMGQVPLSAFDVFSTCTNCPEARILNENTKLLLYVYSFQYQLSYSQVRALIDNALQFLTFSDGRTFTKAGFIKEVKIPFKSFIASFELYSD